MSNTSYSCCYFENKTITKLSPEDAHDNCTVLDSELELLEIHGDDHDQIMFWYGECFGPRDPPEITWQELIIPLFVYG